MPSFGRLSQFSLAEVRRYLEELPDRTEIYFRLAAGFLRARGPLAVGDLRLALVFVDRFLRAEVLAFDAFGDCRLALALIAVLFLRAEVPLASDDCRPALVPVRRFRLGRDVFLVDVLLEAAASRQRARTVPALRPSTLTQSPL